MEEPKEIIVGMNNVGLFLTLSQLQEQLRSMCDMNRDKYITATATNNYRTIKLTIDDREHSSCTIKFEEIK